MLDIVVGLGTSRFRFPAPLGSACGPRRWARCVQADRPLRRSASHHTSLPIDAR